VESKDAMRSCAGERGLTVTTGGVFRDDAEL